LRTIVISWFKEDPARRCRVGYSEGWTYKKLLGNYSYRSI